MILHNLFFVIPVNHGEKFSGRVCVYKIIDCEYITKCQVVYSYIYVTIYDKKDIFKIDQNLYY